MSYRYLCSLITMGQGNINVLKKTIESFKSVVSEFVYGDMLLFEEDREILHQYKQKYNIKIVPLPFNYIFKNGFSDTLNVLADSASNDHIIYMNTSEVIDMDYGISRIIFENPDCNAFYFTHRTDPHNWYRMYNRKDLRWSGLIHEQLKGDYRPYHKPIFCMADLEKDMQDPLKAKIFNDCKEIVYFQQYNNIVDHPEELGETDPGWIKFATDDYGSMKERLLKKGKRYQAFIDGNLPAYMNDVATNPEFESERFESSLRIEFQGSPMFLGKK